MRAGQFAQVRALGEQPEHGENPLVGRTTVRRVLLVEHGKAFRQFLLDDHGVAPVGLLQQDPHPLGLGSVQLADGRWVHGFICEPAALEGATDISHWGGWRAWLASR